MSGYSLRVIKLDGLTKEEVEEAVRIRDSYRKYGLPLARVVVVVQRNNNEQLALFDEAFREIRQAYKVTGKIANIIEYDSETEDDGLRTLFSLVSVIPSLVLAFHQPIERQDCVLVVPGLWNSIMFLQLLAPLAAEGLKNCYSRHMRLEVTMR